MIPVRAVICWPLLTDEHAAAVLDASASIATREGAAGSEPVNELGPYSGSFTFPFTFS